MAAAVITQEYPSNRRTRPIRDCLRFTATPPCVRRADAKFSYSSSRPIATPNVAAIPSRKHSTIRMRLLTDCICLIPTSNRIKSGDSVLYSLLSLPITEPTIPRLSESDEPKEVARYCQGRLRTSAACLCNLSASALILTHNT